MKAFSNLVHALRRFATSLTLGVFEITHNSFALVGVAFVLVALVLGVRPELREQGEAQLFGWLHARQVVQTGMDIETEAIDRATAADPHGLPKQQAAVAYWLSRKYHVAAEPLSALVAEAYELGDKHRLEPTLLLAVMAVESGFNPFAQSPVGAQGLMQVMTHIHSDKYENFGGQFAAFDPVSNLRVGAKVLEDCINRAGSVQGGLKLYVGAGNAEEDGGYAAKVVAEQARLKRVSSGRMTPLHQQANAEERPAVGTIALVTRL